MTNQENSPQEQTNSYTQPSDFTIILNELIRTPSLSCKAYKLLSIGLSHSGKWVFHKKQIATCFKEGMHTVDEAMKELRSLGHLHLKAKMGSKNMLNGHQWFWFANPISEEEFKLFLRDGGFPGLGETGASENSTDIRRLRLKNTNKKNTTTTERREERPPDKPTRSTVVVFSSLKKIKIKQALMETISNDNTEAEVNLAVERCLKWKARANDTVGILTVLKDKETWNDTEDKQEVEDKHKNYLKSLAHLDNTKLGLMDVSVGNDYIQFSGGMKCTVYKTSDKDFIPLVKKAILDLK